MSRYFLKKTNSKKNIKDGLLARLDTIKKQDTGFVHFLKWCYSIGKISWIHAVISAIAGIYIPISYENKQYMGMIIGGLIGILDLIWSYICNEYQKKLFINRRFTSELLEEFSSLVKSLSIFVENDSDWKNKIYGTTSEMVCEKLYSIFKEVLKCETRVSIEYTFQKELQSGESERHVKMAGRKSRHRSMTRNSIPLECKKKYYSYWIFIKNNKGINILETDEIQNEDIWYKNPDNNVDVKRYIGIAVSAFDNNEVNFIIQIDFLDEYKFGKDDSKEDIKEFVDKYLLSYVNVVTLAYLLNLDGKKEMTEV